MIYLLTCDCGLAYVGKTNRALKTRIAEHRSKIRTGDKNSPVAKHFCELNHPVASLRYTGIELITPQRRKGDLERRLRQRELFWIYTLRTKAPNGLNEDFSIKPFL